MTENQLAHAAALRIRARYRRATPGQIQAGRAWYPAAYKVARDAADLAPRGIGPAAMAKVIAALSPRVRWGANVREARAMAAAAGRMDGDLFGDLGREGAAYAAARYALPENARLAAAILAGRRVRVTGPKRGAFARAILGDLAAVTVDVWAAKAAGYDPDRLTPRRVRIITDAYTRAARMVGETPRNLQAIVWLEVRGTDGAAALAEMAGA